MASTLKDDIIVNPMDLFAQISNTSTTAPFSTFTLPLGSRATTGDGRDFRLVQAGATALVIGQLQQGTAVQSNMQGITATAAAVGATSTILTISTGTAIAAGALAGGYYQTYGTTANGGGQNLVISNNTATTSGGTSITITLLDPVQVAVTASANVNLVPPIYAGVVVNATSTTSTPVGVAINNLAANYFGWVQVKGIANAQIQGTPAVGLGLVPSTSTAGALGVEAATTPQIAINLATGVDGRYGPVDLLIS